MLRSSFLWIVNSFRNLPLTLCWNINGNIFLRTKNYILQGTWEKRFDQILKCLANQQSRHFLLVDFLLLFLVFLTRKNIFLCCNLLLSAPVVKYMDLPPPSVFAYKVPRWRSARAASKYSFYVHLPQKEKDRINAFISTIPVFKNRHLGFFFINFIGCLDLWIFWTLLCSVLHIPYLSSL